MGASVGGVAVVAGSGYVDPSLGSLAVDTALVDFDRVVDQYLVLGGEIQVFMTIATCLGEVDRMCFRALDRRAQDVVIAVTVMALRNVFEGVDRSSSMKLIALVGFDVTATTTLGSHSKGGINSMRHRVFVAMAVETPEFGVNRDR